MKGLIVLFGESFRLGGQGTRNRGSIESYNEQSKACESHIKFIEHISDKYKLDSMSVYISTYTTQFDTNLLKIYTKYLVGHTIHDTPIGLYNIYSSVIPKITMDEYDFILFLRIDLCLYEQFNTIFNPMWETIHYPSICWFHHSIDRNNHPRVNSIMWFIPKKYFSILNTTIDISYHDGWVNLIEYAGLTYNDLDVMIHTYHDSDSAKDYNPLYYIVNRPTSKIWHSEGQIFTKSDWPKQ